MKKTNRWLALTSLAQMLTGCDEELTSSHSPEGHSLWQTDYDAALQTAAAENKHLLMDFSGSDWCGWCIKLDNEVFSQPAFIEYAKKNLVLVLVDFPRADTQTDDQKAANNALAERYGIQGFPTVLILNPQGEVIERTGYQRGGADAYVEMIEGVISK